MAGDVDATLGFVGDVMLGRSETAHWQDREPTGVWGSTLPRLRSLDGFFLNLECCIANRGEQWPNKTFYFRAAPSVAVPALEAAGTSFAALANNHVMDYGSQGLCDTRMNLRQADISFTGAGLDRSAATEPEFLTINSLRIAVFSLTDQMPAFAAGADTPGTAYVPHDRSRLETQILVRDIIQRIKEQEPDLVIASLHWGPNWETTPAPPQTIFARWLVDLGVDIVHGHSAHVLQGIEVYRGRPILYETGDFVHDYIDKDDRYNKHSALVELHITRGELDELQLVPMTIENETVKQASSSGAKTVRELLRNRSAEFGTTTTQRDAGLVVPLDDC